MFENNVYVQKKLKKILTNILNVNYKEIKRTATDCKCGGCGFDYHSED